MHRAISWTVPLLVVVWQPAARAGGEQVGVAVDAGRVLRQDDLDLNSCGVSCLINALQFGDAACRKALAGLPGETVGQKAAGVLDRLGGKPSRDYGEGLRRRANGVSCADLADIVGEAVAGAGLAARGEFLDRRDQEADRSFLLRVHGQIAEALRAGRPPIVSMRSFVVVRDESQADGFAWNGVRGHFVVVTRVPATLADYESGFAFEFIDPGSGRVESGFVYLQRQRAFLAAKGNNDRYEWKRGSPFLLVSAPSLSMGLDTQPWWARSIVTLNYVIVVTPEGASKPQAKPE